MELTKENFIEEISAAQVEARTVHVVTTTTIGGQELSMEGQAVISEDAKTDAATLSMDLAALGGSSMDLRMVDQVLYVNMGQATQDEFYRIDLGGDSDVDEFSDMLEQVNPSAQLKMIGESMTDFSVEGDGGEIDGVPTTRYVLMIDPVAMYEAQGLDPETMVDLPDAVEYVVHVGADLLPRRMEAEIPGTGSSAVEWSRWGEEIAIEVPDDDQVTDEPPAGLTES
ncbi:hypothetical protein [Aeromicrobium piscarium]|uniref:LppX_LprAFG lipoprotein n=1 Tax=Aeromicrobium piscarium TaxID=2590901 RepID=A0A554RX66_9ACTN|nr:hypothetical protein [Aeromicrobium piscarium]TSD58687.1 hypothetical protein FNM00_13590 [Aeromicrobium piscarium]